MILSCPLTWTWSVLWQHILTWRPVDEFKFARLRISTHVYVGVQIYSRAPKVLLSFIGRQLQSRRRNPRQRFQSLECLSGECGSRQSVLTKKEKKNLKFIDILIITCTVVMNSGNLNFLGLSGWRQACNGTDLPFLIIITNKWKFEDKQKRKEKFHPKVVFLFSVQKKLHIFS